MRRGSELPPLLLQHSQLGENRLVSSLFRGHYSKADLSGQWFSTREGSLPRKNVPLSSAGIKAGHFNEHIMRRLLFFLQHHLNTHAVANSLERGEVLLFPARFDFRRSPQHPGASLRAPPLPRGMGQKRKWQRSRGRPPESTLSSQCLCDWATWGKLGLQLLELHFVPFLSPSQAVTHTGSVRPPKERGKLPSGGTAGCRRQPPGLCLIRDHVQEAAFGAS